MKSFKKENLFVLKHYRDLSTVNWDELKIKASYHCKVFNGFCGPLEFCVKSSEKYCKIIKDIIITGGGRCVSPAECNISRTIFLSQYLCRPVSNVCNVYSISFIIDSINQGKLAYIQHYCYDVEISANWIQPFLEDAEFPSFAKSSGSTALPKSSSKLVLTSSKLVASNGNRRHRKLYSGKIDLNISSNNSIRLDNPKNNGNAEDDSECWPSTNNYLLSNSEENISVENDRGCPSTSLKDDSRLLADSEDNISVKDDNKSRPTTLEDVEQHPTAIEVVEDRSETSEECMSVPLEKDQADSVELQLLKLFGDANNEASGSEDKSVEEDISFLESNIENKSVKKCKAKTRSVHVRNVIIPSKISNSNLPHHDYEFSDSTGNSDYSISPKSKDSEVQFENDCLQNGVETSNDRITSTSNRCASRKGFRKLLNNACIYKHSRHPYSRQEKIEILRFIISRNAFCRLKSLRLYKNMEELLICRNRTAESMKTHFLKTIINELDTFDFVDEKIKKKFLKGFYGNANKLY